MTEQAEQVRRMLHPEDMDDRQQSTPTFSGDGRGGGEFSQHDNVDMPTWALSEHLPAVNQTDPMQLLKLSGLVCFPFNVLPFVSSSQPSLIGLYNCKWSTCCVDS